MSPDITLQALTAPPKVKQGRRRRRSGHSVGPKYSGKEANGQLKEMGLDLGEGKGVWGWWGGMGWTQGVGVVVTTRPHP